MCWFCGKSVAFTVHGVDTILCEVKERCCSGDLNQSTLLVLELHTEESRLLLCSDKLVFGELHDDAEVLKADSQPDDDDASDEFLLSSAPALYHDSQLDRVESSAESAGDVPSPCVNVLVFSR